MYHPSRGGVRGGTDQFTWDTVKTDKHRENYLGHSVMAPVGRWQKGKDLSWYAKERKGQEGDQPKQKTNQLSAIKIAEEEAMLIALGLKPPRREGQAIPKEEVAEILKRGQEDRSTTNIERVGGVGMESGRASMLIGNPKRKSSTGEGVNFESHSLPKKGTDESYATSKREKVSSSSKKHKKEKKRKKKKKHKRKHSSESNESDSGSENEADERTKHCASKSDVRNMSSKNNLSEKSKKRSRSISNDKTTDKHRDHGSRHDKRKHNDSSSEDEAAFHASRNKNKQAMQNRFPQKPKMEKRHRDSIEDDDYAYKSKKERFQSDDYSKNERKRDNTNYKKPQRHDTSESD